MPPPASLQSTLHPLTTLSPPCTSRTWLSTPHPSLPLLATACSDKSVRLYSLQTFKQVSLISGGHKRSIRACAWKAHGVAGESVLATGSFDASAGIWKRWEVGGGGGGGVAAGRGEDGEDAEEVDFTGGLAGGRVQSHGEGEGDDDDEEEWRLEVLLDGHDSEIKSLAFCPTAPLLATCSRDKSVWIWEELDDGENFETMAVLQDHEGDVKCVGWHPEEQLLASGSYDDKVRLWREDVDDWACCALLDGHAGTVWWVEFEGSEQVGRVVGGIGQMSEEWVEGRKKSGPRLMSCSDDKTIRVWRRRPKESANAEPPTGQGRMPSIWKNNNFEEDWYEEARLPQVHDRPIYAVSWSKKTGRVVSTGSDGLIVVYEERWRKEKPVDIEMANTVPEHADGIAQHTDGAKTSFANLTEWVVVAQVENAHDVFEVNHVVWAPRCDKGKRFEGEEVVVSTGDDGEVKVWTLED